MLDPVKLNNDSVCQPIESSVNQTIPGNKIRLISIKSNKNANNRIPNCNSRDFAGLDFLKDIRLSGIKFCC